MSFICKYNYSLIYIMHEQTMVEPSILIGLVIRTYAYNIMTYAYTIMHGLPTC